MNKLYDQITNLIEKSQNILILTHARADCDGLGAALSAYLVLKELGKDVTVATNDPAPENLHFLPSIDILHNSLASSKDFIITVDSAKADIANVKYNIEGSKVNIIITPKGGSLSSKDVSFDQSENKFDLIIVLDTGNLEHLGPLYDKNVEMFFETPVINMDHHTSNTDFGQVNLVDSTASSTTEILYEYLADLEKKYDKKLITEDIATLLLAGIITDTGSFQHANTSPHAMETSSKLLDLGARQQEIIKNIYKTKKLSTLKLWGIILSKVQVDPVHRMVWSTISKDDLQEADADPGETEGVIDDLLTNAPGAEVIFLIKQNPEYVSCSMRSTNNQTDVGKFCADNGGGGHIRAAGFKVRGKKPFEEITNEVVGKVRKFQAERLNIHEGGDDAVEAIHELPQDNPADTPATETPAKDKPAAEQKTTYLDFKAPEKPDAKQDVQPEVAPAVSPVEPVAPVAPVAPTTPNPTPPAPMPEPVQNQPVAPVNPMPEVQQPAAPAPNAQPVQPVAPMPDQPVTPAPITPMNAQPTAPQAPMAPAPAPMPEPVQQPAVPVQPNYSQPAAVPPVQQAPAPVAPQQSMPTPNFQPVAEPAPVQPEPVPTPAPIPAPQQPVAPVTTPAPDVQPVKPAPQPSPEPQKPVADKPIPAPIKPKPVLKKVVKKVATKTIKTPAVAKPVIKKSVATVAKPAAKPTTKTTVNPAATSAIKKKVAPVKKAEPKKEPESQPAMPDWLRPEAIEKATKNNGNA